MIHIEAIDREVEQNTAHGDIARKIFLTYPTHVFIGKEDREYAILNNISSYFSVPIMSVQITGSAKVGRSFHKKTNFTARESDLDVAIIDAALFVKYFEIVFRTTDGYANQSDFPRKDGVSRFPEYISYIAKGMFRPDLMPSCPQRGDWNKFFGHLSQEHSDLFKSINASIFVSQVFFENKQRSAIAKYISTKGL